MKKHQFITDNDGNALFAIVPMEEYNHLLKNAPNSYQENDFYYELTDEELRSLEQAEQQSKLGLLTDSEEVHQEALQRLMGKIS